MKFTRHLAITALSCCIYLSSTAQTLPHTLLWRISGRNGHKTAYLYGTMHLTDKRLFDLGDSLYEAIRHAEGFATEVDMQSLSALIIGEVEKEIYNKKNLKDILTEKEYKTYG